MSHAHHLANMLLTSVGATTAIGSVLPGDHARSIILFVASILCTCIYIVINMPHLIRIVKSWSKGINPPEEGDKDPVQENKD